MVKTGAALKGNKKKSRSAIQTTEKYQLKCKNCSGFEEKLGVVEENYIKEEVTLMQKHEIIRQMSMCMGADIECLQHAEKLFDNFKYLITEYVVKHEFNRENKLSMQMVLWLEEKCCPTSMAPLHSVITEYLQRRICK
ncbi:MAG: hypothetical protein LDLANPLL_01089 [Turneriella sp.]|nr:hypothetical protein [Turneriella sp.]